MRLASLAPWCALAALTLASCGSSSSKASDAAPEDSLVPTCGHPGDPGNAQGVGKFCNTISDCIGNADAPLCATLGDANAHFCTRLCDPDGGTVECGDGATCVCGSGSGGSGCGCTPVACL